MIPFGYCLCGCGELAPLAKYTDHRRGWVKGQPIRFIQYHARAIRDAIEPHPREDHRPVTTPLARGGMRDFLRCSKPFASWDVRANRLCPSCKATLAGASHEPIRGRVRGKLRER